MPDDWKKKGIPRGTITWRQGKKWQVLPPRDDGTYHSEDMMYLDRPIPGTTKFAVGKGSAYKTLQVVGGRPEKDADVDLGWAKVHISAKDKNLTMKFLGGKEAADDRWAQEQQAMQEFERQSYQNAPQGEVVERIPKVSVIKEQPQVQSALERLVTRAKSQGINVEFVPSEKLHDYGGMNWIVAKDMGIPDYPENTIWVDDSYQMDGRSLAETQYINLRHELDEVADMSKGEPYWQAHQKALAGEERPIVIQQPQQPKKDMRLKVNRQRPNDGSRYYLGRKLRPTSLGQAI